MYFEGGYQEDRHLAKLYAEIERRWTLIKAREVVNAYKENLFQHENSQALEQASSS